MEDRAASLLSPAEVVWLGPFKAGPIQAAVYETCGAWSPKLPFVPLAFPHFASSVLPGNLLPVPVEAARRVLRQHRAEDNRPSADLDAPVGSRSAHVGPHPARADRVDPDLSWGEFAREDPREGIHRDLGH